jgi:hypothetical protein
VTRFVIAFSVFVIFAGVGRAEPLSPRAFTDAAAAALTAAMPMELARGPYSLTSDLLVYRDGRFVKFDEK